MLEILSKFEGHTQRIVDLRICSRRAAWTEEKKESASHHVFAFAQLRAEMSENDAGEARRSSEIIRICYSHDFLISSFCGVFKCFGWYVFDQCPAQGSCQRHRNNAIEFSFERLFSKVRPLKMICWKKCRNSMLIPARRATWIGEKEESASHHLKSMFTFAQLRTEVAKNDAPEA